MIVSNSGSISSQIMVPMMVIVVVLVKKIVMIDSGDCSELVGR